MSARPTPSGTTRIVGIDRAHLLGYLYGLLTAACWGASSIFVRKGLVGLPSALWASRLPSGPRPAST
ncbi:MAG: hypothetical protein ACT4PO_02870 [Actinomycetota bacterium]